MNKTGTDNMVALPVGLVNVINAESRKYANALVRGVLTHNVERFLSEEPMSIALRRRLHKQTTKLIDLIAGDGIHSPSQILTIMEK